MSNLSTDSPPCCICKSSKFERRGDQPWSQKCVERVACEERCVAGAYAEQFVEQIVRARRDRKVGLKPLGEATCDECTELAFTRWYDGTKAVYTLCAEHNTKMREESRANRERLGLE